MKTCCIISQPTNTLPFGHKKEAEACVALKRSFRTAAEKLITEQGVTNFLSDMSLGIPLYAAEEILVLRGKYPQIRLECVFPYETQAETWSETFRDRYFAVAADADGERFFRTRYAEGCENDCRRYLIDRSDVVLTAFEYADGTLPDYVRESGKEVVSLGALAV